MNAPKNVFWADNGQTIIITLEDTFYLLQYNNDIVDQALKKIGSSGASDAEDDGIEDAFTFVEEFNETVNSGIWISNECFVFVNSKGVVSYLIGNKIIKLTSTDKKYFILGYDQK